MNTQKILRLLLRAAGITLLSISLIRAAGPEDAPEVPSVSLEGLGETTPQPPPARAEAVIQTRTLGSIGSDWGVAVEPGEEIEFTLQGGGDQKSTAAWSPESADGGALDWNERIEWSLPGGSFSRSTSGGFKIRAPKKPGNAKFTLAIATALRDGQKTLGAPTRVAFDMTLLVKAPFDRGGNGALDGYPVGIYPNEAGKNVSNVVQEHSDLYKPPKSFILVTPEVAGLRISEHFRLKDFSPRMEAGKKHYIALDRRLVDFLETAIDACEPGFGKPKSGGGPMTILIGYLSPNHLAQLRSKNVRIAEFSRYQYGDGAAVIWDADGDQKMDDLNHDGNIDETDARMLADKFEEVQKKLGKFGGIGTAGSPKIPDLPQTPYVDIDMRGIGTRW